VRKKKVATYPHIRPWLPFLKPLIVPDKRGFYDKSHHFGGRYVPEVLMPNLLELEDLFLKIVKDKSFWQEYLQELASFSGRPTPITYAHNLSEHLGGARILLKREDLNQTGAHKINNVIGQGLMVKRLGKKRVIAETGAGQHGVATATMAARFGLKARIYMGAEDVQRQRPNVFWMEKLGAEVIAVTEGSRTLKDAINEALRDWATHLDSTHYVLGTACGPHPFPMIVSYFQSVIGYEAYAQMQAQYGALPHAVYACVGGGSNAMGIFQGFLQNKKVRLVGVEAGGRGEKIGEHAARLAKSKKLSAIPGSLGIAQGYKSIFLQDDDGQLLDTHSVAAGLDYVGVSPVIADLHEKGRLDITSASDDEVLETAKLLMKHEGIIPALESTHALVRAVADAPKMKKSQMILVNLSGRGDKDIFTFGEVFGDENWRKFLEFKSQVSR
jgi:tryptophan synthase beta chain